MSRKGNSPDNSLMESFFGILKSEMFYGYEKTLHSLEQLEQAIVDYIDYYNNKRIKVKWKGLNISELPCLPDICIIICCCLVRSASLFVLIEIISKMIHPMKVQLNSIEKRKISHFFSVLFRSAGRMSIMIAGRPTIKVQNIKPNPMLESSPTTPSKNHPRAQRITGMVAMAIMMRFV